MSERRTTLRETLADLAGLPETQRHALLRRELDGISHATLAPELDVTETASKMLVHRARTNLVKGRDARTIGCATIRDDLLEGP